jgi:hypothetical protein
MALMTVFSCLMAQGVMQLTLWATLVTITAAIYTLEIRFYHREITGKCTIKFITLRVQT